MPLVNKFLRLKINSRKFQNTRDYFMSYIMNIPVTVHCWAVLDVRTQGYPALVI